jgi:hypothetical protein
MHRLLSHRFRCKSIVLSSNKRVRCRVRRLHLHTTVGHNVRRKLRQKSQLSTTAQRRLFLSPVRSIISLWWKPNQYSRLSRRAPRTILSKRERFSNSPWQRRPRLQLRLSTAYPRKLCCNPTQSTRNARRIVIVLCVGQLRWQLLQEEVACGHHFEQRVLLLEKKTATPKRTELVLPENPLFHPPRVRMEDNRFG